MKFDLTPGRPARLLIGGAPEGHDARVLAALAQRAGAAGVIHVAIDDGRAARLADALAFFDPALEVLSFPAWDCLPYDRVSPHPAIVSRRIATLTRLLVPPPAGGRRLVLATVGAMVQRLPPRQALSRAGFRAKVGERIEVAGLQAVLIHNGYSRAQTVREPGEFAIRGGIIDLFPPGSEEPLRLDLFGDTLEGVRRFDPLSQRTTEKCAAIDLMPMAELFLDEPSISRFRSGYRELFGAVTGTDPLYEAISAGRKHPGMEHWLPLFHPRLETLSDYLPQAILSLDHQVDESLNMRLTQVEDFYDARKSLRAAERAVNAPAYKPLPPGRLYLDGDEWALIQSCHAVAQLSPFTPPPGLIGQVDAGGKRSHDFTEARARPDLNVFDVVHQHIAELATGGRRVMVAGYSEGSRDRLLTVLADHGITGLEPAASWREAERFGRGTLAMIVLGIENGFVAPDLALITEQDILGDRLARPPKKRKRAANFIAEQASLAAGDLVVHVEYGIGRYDGLETVTVTGAPHDCLRILYDGNEKLFVPVENIDMLSRYGSEDATGAQLDKLGGTAWQGRKARVKKRLKDMADALLKIAAERELRKGEPLTPADGLYSEFAARFPFPETEDQLTAIADVLEDLSSGRPMDRLVCGDVGFGKTEVALRAAFVAALSGQQVAVVVPTTLLARQHHRSFADRFAGLPVQVGALSRLVTAKDAALVKKGLADGSLDIVVGTHALLAKSISFKRLGLVVVDEEQHFGVKQKERLKELRANVHVLTLTATPIPRTLQLALSGVRELTVIATPPVDRLAVRTFVLPYDPVVIREAILREHFRGGQSFYVCPRIEDLAKVAERLRELVPEVKVVTAHGQMAASELEEVMTAFDDRGFDVLLATNIIESGLDIPNANTLIIHRADLFGLAQLYQLRGRVGRSKQRGYAYLTTNASGLLSAAAQQRLHVIGTLDTLGAGFQLASHDMDIRGAGNLLGEEQSGHIKEVGVELYQSLLEQAVAAARAGSGAAVEAERWTPQINLGMPVLIPESYVADLAVRLGLYRRLADLTDRAELDAFAAELIDRFGKLPLEVNNLLEVVAIKQLCRTAGIERVDAGPKGAVLTFHDNRFARPERLIAYLAREAGTVRLRPDHKLVSSRAWDSAELRLKGTLRLIKDLAHLISADSLPPLDMSAVIERAAAAKPAPAPAATAAKPAKPAARGPVFTRKPVPPFSGRRGR